jgi:uncharacterized membrane protein YedE/YeeE
MAIDYKTEQIIVIITTVLSLITAGVWSEVLESLFEIYLGNKIKYKIIFAVVLSVITVYLVDWLVSNTDLITPEKKEKLRHSKISNYVRNVLS